MKTAEIARDENVLCEWHTSPSVTNLTLFLLASVTRPARTAASLILCWCLPSHPFGVVNTTTIEDTSPCQYASLFPCDLKMKARIFSITYANWSQKTLSTVIPSGRGVGEKPAGIGRYSGRSWSFHLVEKCQIQKVEKGEDKPFGFIPTFDFCFHQGLLWYNVRYSQSSFIKTCLIFSLCSVNTGNLLLIVIYNWGDFCIRKGLICRKVRRQKSQT